MIYNRQSQSFIDQGKVKKDEILGATPKDSGKDNKIFHLLIYSNFDILMFFLLSTNLSNFFTSRALSFDICSILYLGVIIVIFFIERAPLRCGCTCFCVCIGALVTNTLMMETNFSIPDLLDIPLFFILTGFPLPILVFMASQNFLTCIVLKLIVQRLSSTEIIYLNLQILIICFMFSIKLVIGLLLYFEFFIISNLATYIKNHPSQSIKFIPEIHAMEEKAITTLPIAFSLSQTKLLSEKEHSFILLRLYQYSKFRNVILSILHEDNMNSQNKMKDLSASGRKHQESISSRNKTNRLSVDQCEQQVEKQLGNTVVGKLKRF
jgi:hypothetical protein